jgi:hypothetical protein
MIHWLEFSKTIQFDGGKTDVEDIRLKAYPTLSSVTQKAWQYHSLEAQA